MQIELNLVTYNTILSGFCHAGMLKDALQLVGKMLAGGTKHDAITYNTVIYAYCEQGEVKTAVQLVDRLTEERGIQTYLHGEMENRHTSLSQQAKNWFCYCRWKDGWRNYKRREQTQCINQDGCGIVISGGTSTFLTFFCSEFVFCCC
uniref:Pentacotripeptide-repeat region of PRORP domain-containing protein n=1 Tax=Populus davidiana TaxID=266767 RepID=A0A6M2EEV3_9ROSI